MVLEAGYPDPYGRGFRKVVKVTVLVKKKPGISDAEFVEHYNHKHAQLAAPVLMKHHVITYSLVSISLNLHNTLDFYSCIDLLGSFPQKLHANNPVPLHPDSISCY